MIKTVRSYIKILTLLMLMTSAAAFYAGATGTEAFFGG